MSSVASAFGLRPVYHPSGLIRARCLPNGIASGQAGAILQGQAVLMTAAAGTLAAVTTNAQNFLGSFAGIEYTPLGGRPVEANFYPGSVTFDTSMPVNVYYYDDPEIVYEIQGDGSIAAATVGQEFNLSNFAAGSTTTGLSAETCTAATVGTGVQGQLVHEGFAPYVDNAYGDAFTIIQVKIIRHQFRAVVVSI